MASTLSDRIDVTRPPPKTLQSTQPLLLVMRALHALRRLKIIQIFLANAAREAPPTVDPLYLLLLFVQCSSTLSRGPLVMCVLREGRSA